MLYVSEEIANATAEALKVDPINVYAPELITKAQAEALQKQIDDQARARRQLRGADDDIDEELGF